ncbi:MAG: hypothetical protein JST21_00510 [Bacteroidetes bacterium]|nr:hypothetical protein [Bacteroidota bacterium]
MQYINPYQLLNISAESLSDVDVKTISRERRRLLHQIELSEHGTIDYNGIEITRAEYIRVLDELDEKNKREFHFFIFQNSSLNNFLTSGTLYFFDKHTAESIYKLPAFINFISPYFEPRYDEVLSTSFKSGNKENIKKILSVQPLTTTSFNESCYKSTYHFLKDVDKEINQIIDEIKDEESPYIQKSFRGIETEIKSKVSPELINLLPAYFQGIRNQIAMSIRNLARDINNDPYNLIEPAFKVSSIANEIESDGLTKQTVSKGYSIIKGRYEDLLQQKENEKYEPHIDKCYSLIDAIVDKRDAINKKEISASHVNNWVNSNINITELNNLPSAAFQVRNLVALSLKSLSVAVWNNLDEIDIAISVLAKATLLRVNEDTKAVLVEAKIQLDELKAKIQRQRLANLQQTTNYPKKEKSSFGVLIVIGIIILIIYLISNSNNSHNSSSSSYNDNSTNSYSPPPATVDTAKSDIAIAPQSIDTYQTEPVYNKVTMVNGNISDCSGISPKYDKNISTKLIITAQLTDVAVKLYDYETDRCIRYVFVNDGSTYAIKNIPEGKYYLKIAYGNDWEVKEGDPVCKGRFATHSSFKKDLSVYDFNKTYYNDGRVSVPYYTLKLYRTYTTNTYDDNSAGNSISESDFNNN